MEKVRYNPSEKRPGKRGPNRLGHRAFQWGLVLLMILLGGNGSLIWGEEQPEAETKPEPAEIKIGGYGLLGNRQLKKSLAILQENDQFPAVLDANFVEDATMILLSRLAEEGYLQAEIRTVMKTSNYGEIDQPWKRDQEIILPRPLAVTAIQFEINRGVQYYYDSLQFEGLDAMPERTAHRYFLEIDTLLRLKSSRVYTPNRLQGSMESLQLALQRLGFRGAKVSVGKIERDDETGAVRVLVKVEEGPRWWVRSVTTEILGPGGEGLAPGQATNVVNPNEAFSVLWEQDFLQEKRVDLYRRGYPDATASLTSTNHQTGGITNIIDLTVTVQSGPLIHLGELHFDGLQKTRPRVVERRLQLEPGDVLNRVEVDRARLRLARLGVFDSVDLSYEPTVPGTRDVRFTLEEGRKIDFHLLFGFGSYELLRGGFELEQHNIFGLAHHSRLQAIQSFRASSADYIYSMPDLGGKDLNLFFNASALRREEVSFEREEVLLGVGGARTFPSVNSDIGLRYNYEFLNANDSSSNLAANDEVVQVAAVVLDFKHDRRDSPLSPKQGYKVLANLELASASMGGEVDYQRFEMSSSWHTALGGGRYFHIGFSHGVAMTLNSEDTDLPINKRFFPGGENSIRGFQQGEASPRDANGDLIGAETFTLGNLEFEQKLTRSFSAVVLFDALGFAQNVEDYPFDEALYTVGGGLWWKTIIGPVRLEYGHNLNPRQKDPSGTLHVSLGFPF